MNSYSKQHHLLWLINKNNLHLIYFGKQLLFNLVNLQCVESYNSRNTKLEGRKTCILMCSQLQKGISYV